MVTDLIKGLFVSVHVICTVPADLVFAQIPDLECRICLSQLATHFSTFGGLLGFILFIFLLKVEYS